MRVLFNQTKASMTLAIRICLSTKVRIEDEPGIVHIYCHRKLINRGKKLFATEFLEAPLGVTLKWHATAWKNI